MQKGECPLCLSRLHWSSQVRGKLQRPVLVVQNYRPERVPVGHSDTLNRRVRERRKEDEPVNDQELSTLSAGEPQTRKEQRMEKTLARLLAIHMVLSSIQASKPTPASHRSFVDKKNLMPLSVGFTLFIHRELLPNRSKLL